MTEAAIIAVAAAVQSSAELGMKVIDSAPKEVQAELWKLHLEDVKEARAFWRKLLNLGN